MKCFLPLLLLLVAASPVNAQPIIETIPLGAPDQPAAVEPAIPAARPYSAVQPARPIPIRPKQQLGTTTSDPAPARRAAAPAGPPADARPLLEKLDRLLAEPNPDPGRIALAFGKHVIKDLPEEKAIGLLDNWGQVMKLKIGLTEEPEDRAFLIGQTVTDNIEIKSIPNPTLNLPAPAGEAPKRYPEEMFWLHNAITQRSANHVGLASLYMALAHRAGISLKPVLMPDHMYLAYEEGGETFYLEPTNEGQITDAGLYHRAASTRARAHHRPLDLREFSGLMLTYMADYYQSSEQPDAARVCAETAVEWFPEGDAGWVVLAMSLRDADRDEDAITCYDRALKLNPDEFIALHNRAFALLQLERHVEAERDFRALLQEKPNYERAKLGLMKSLDVQGRTEEVKELAREFAQKNPSLNDQLYRRAVAAFQAGEVEAAIELINEFIIRIPNDPRGHHAHGNMLIAIKDVEGGIASYDKALALDPGFTKSRMAKVQTYMLMGDAAKAKDAAKGLVATNPDNAEVYHVYGSVLLANKQLPEAIEQLDRATELDPSLADSWFAKIEAYLALGDVPKAEEAARGLIAVNPSNPNGYHTLGKVFLTTKRIPQAIEQFDKATEMDPGFTEAWLAKTELNLAIGDVPKAEAAANGLLAADPNNPKNHHTIGKIFLSAKKVPEAIEQFDLATQVDPTFMPSWMAKAQTYLLAGDLPKAEESVNEILRFAPETPELVPMRAAIHVEKKEYKEAAPLLEEHLRVAPASQRLDLRRDLTMLYMTQEEVKNPVRAVELAEAIGRITEEKSPADLVLLAAAYNANGQPGKADETFQKAEDLARNAEEKLFLLRQYRKLRDVSK